MKLYKIIIGLVLTTSSIYGQWNDQLWDYYLREEQLINNKVKLIVVENGDIIKHTIRPDGKLLHTVLANSNGHIIGDDKYCYWGDTVNQVQSYREENIFIKKDYLYKDGILNEIDIRRNDFLTEKIEYSIYPNGWIGFVSRRSIEGYFEHVLWTKKIHYYTNGLIKAIDLKRGFINYNSYYVYNWENLIIQKETISFIEDDGESNQKEILISTYDNGLTKSINNEGYIQQVSYQYYTENEFNAAIDTLGLVISEFNSMQKLKADLIKKVEKQYPYIPRDINYKYFDYVLKVKHLFKNREKLGILSEMKIWLDGLLNLEETELRKMNREVKKKYGLKSIH